MASALRPDDLKVGDFVTVLHGREIKCDCGAVHGQCYERLQGLPMELVAINLPFLAAGMVVGRVLVVLDIRDATLMRLETDYVKAFQSANAGK